MKRNLYKLINFLQMWTIYYNLHNVTSKQVAEKSVSDAVARLRGNEKRKGFSSTHRVVTAISIDSGKVLDVAVLSKSCKGCTSMNKWFLLITLIMRHGSYLIIVTLIIPALPLEWKQQELLRSLVHQKRNMDYITFLFMEMVTARHMLLWKV